MDVQEEIVLMKLHMEAKEIRLTLPLPNHVKIPKMPLTKFAKI